MAGRPSLKLQDIFSVVGKVVLVTGGGSGIGKAIAEAFTVNGAKVYITGRRKETLERTAAEINGVAGNDGGVCIPLKGDVSDKKSCASIINDFKTRESRLDVLVNNAGVSKAFDYPAWDHNDADQVEKALWEGVDDDHFSSTNAVNVNGIYFLTTGFIPLLRKSSNPSVIVISSLSGVTNQRTMGSTTYAISKAAAVHCAKLLAGRLSPMKIRVNCICPGIWPSEMTGSDMNAHSYNINSYALAAAKRCVAGRPGLPAEIAGPCLLLATEAGGYINGDVMLVEGGRAMGCSINDGIRMPEDTYV